MPRAIGKSLFHKPQQSETNHSPSSEMALFRCKTGHRTQAPPDAPTKTSTYMSVGYADCGAWSDMSNYGRSRPKTTLKNCAQTTTIDDCASSILDRWLRCTAVSKRHTTINWATLWHCRDEGWVQMPLVVSSMSGEERCTIAWASAS